jgi:maltose-binding protein MalE
MTKIKKCAFALAAVAATTLSGCGKNYDVVFWSSFGGDYTQYLNPIVEDIADKLGYKVQHVSKKSYPGVLDAMVSSIATGKYPNVVVGYPDHFAQYHGSKILLPLDDMVSAEMLADFDANYMPENYLYDQDGTKHLYGLPFNKSTELLGYNQVFVEYCDWKNPGKDLLNLPATWDEWADYSNPESKVSIYMKEFEALVTGKEVWYASQDEAGHASNFEKSASAVAGKTKVFDYSKSEWETCRLFTWDSTDNAFITLVRQWGSQYTVLPESQYSITPKKRKGHVLFANNDNLGTTVDMLKYFNKMHKAHVFGTPSDFGTNTNFSSDSFKRGEVMFVVCSSGGLAHNTGTWQCRFKSAPIPYKTADKKFVISQGADICMTKKGDSKKSFEFMKALTTGEFQTKWAIDTGYFPASKSSENHPDYIEFLNGTNYSDELAVYKREGAKTNHDHYSNAAENWQRFVDDAFIGSAKVREIVGVILPNIFSQIKAADVEDDTKYYKEIKDILSQPVIKSNTNIAIELADVLK